MAFHAPLFAALAAMALAVPTVVSHAETRTPQFQDYPFDQWAAAPDYAAIKWDVKLPPQELSMHQRILARVEVIVPGWELEKRRGRGELVWLARFEDSTGRQFRTGDFLNLTTLQRGIQSQELTFTVAAFVKPGDYRVEVAVFDTKAMEHSFAHRTLHVAPMRADPLPQAWSGLPPVEILPGSEPPQSWFLPDVKGLLNLPLPPSSAPPPHIELLVNITPSLRSMNGGGNLRRSMGMAMAALKDLGALNAKVRPPSASVMDVTRHRISLEMPNAGTPDWGALGRLLATGNNGIIDAKSLAGQSTMRDYFAHEVARRADDSAEPRWLIVLSGPLRLSQQDESGAPIPPPDPRRHIICYRFVPVSPFVPPPDPFEESSDERIAPPRRVRGPTPGLGLTLPGDIGRGRGADAGFPDDLDLILKPMGARVVTITTPQAFRKALAALIREIGANRLD